jgi:molybdopterin biosynthesis enzyme
VRLERIAPGRPLPPGLAGAVLTRDLGVAGRRLSKGTRLTRADLEAIAVGPPGRPVTVLVPGPDDVHEDDAALRLAAAVSGGDPDVILRGPVQSRVDLVAARAGIVEVRVAALERLNRLDALEVFTVIDGQAVAAGDLVASVKVAPHLVPEQLVAAGETASRRASPIVRVRPFRPVRIAVLVKGEVAAASRERFEAAIRAKLDGLGAIPAGVTYVADDPDAVTDALRVAVGWGRHRAGIVLTAGGASTDPGDSLFMAVEALGGRVVRRGVPAHPGSMLWLARIGRTAVVGLPSCGAYSMATAADLLLARLVAGQPATAGTVARLAHGGILARTQRFRFPAYARELDAPDT